MPVLTVSVRQADELHRLAYLEAAGLLRQAADGLQDGGESAVAPRDQAGMVAGRDLAVWLDQARSALDLVGILDAGDRPAGVLIGDDLRAGVLEVLTGHVDTLVDTVAVTNGTGPLDRADLESRRQVDDLTAGQHEQMIRLLEQVDALCEKLRGAADAA